MRDDSPPIPAIVRHYAAILAAWSHAAGSAARWLGLREPSAPRHWSDPGDVPHIDGNADFYQRRDSGLQG